MDFLRYMNYINFVKEMLPGTRFIIDFLVATSGSLAGLSRYLGGILQSRQVILNEEYHLMVKMVARPLYMFFNSIPSCFTTH
jgi:hypothetical protein